MTYINATNVVLLGPSQVAAQLGVSTTTLFHWRKRGEGPPVTKVGKQFRYRLDELDSWRENERGEVPLIDRDEVAK
jgi:predicted site-specific integrase-resolvase